MLSGNYPSQSDTIILEQCQNDMDTFSTQTEGTPVSKEAIPWFQTTMVQREATSSEGESAVPYIALSIFAMLFCCMPLGIVALIGDGKFPSY